MPVIEVRMISSSTTATSGLLMVSICQWRQERSSPCSDRMEQVSQPLSRSSRATAPRPLARSRCSDTILRKAQRAYKERIGIVLQETAIEEQLTVSEAIDTYGSMYPNQKAHRPS